MVQSSAATRKSSTHAHPRPSAEAGARDLAEVDITRSFVLEAYVISLGSCGNAWRDVYEWKGFATRVP